MRPNPIERIHNINHTFNRIFSGPLYVAAWVVLMLLVILPYSGRIILAFLINLLFNRPLVYLNYLARLIARPLNACWMTLGYLIIVGSYALIGRLFGARRLGFGQSSSLWHPMSESTDRTSAFFQS